VQTLLTDLRKVENLITENLRRATLIGLHHTIKLPLQHFISLAKAMALKPLLKEGSAQQFESKNGEPKQ